MDIMLILIIGLIVGSFLNVCICRIPKNESIAYPPSHCINCGMRIKWYDLFPVVSFINLRGRCRNCRSKISIRYPFIEVLTGAIFVSLYIKYGFVVDFFKYVFLSIFLIVISFIDLDTTDVYLKTTLPGIVIGVVFIIIEYLNGQNPIQFIYGAIISWAVIAVIAFTTHSMGWGDAEICLMCGAFLGTKLSIVMLMLSFVLGGIIGGMLVLFKIKSRKDIIPFGPFIGIAAIFTMLFGSNIVDWYISYLIL